MFVLRHGNVRVTEDLVDVRIHCYTLPVGRVHKAGPIRQRLEGVVDEENSVGLLRGAVWITNIAVRVIPILRCDGKNSITVEARRSESQLKIELD